MYCAIAEHIYSAKNQWVKCALASLLAFGLWPTSSAYADSPEADESVSDSVLMEGAAYSNETDDLSVDAESDKAVEEADDDLCQASDSPTSSYFGDLCDENASDSEFEGVSDPEESENAALQTQVLPDGGQSDERPLEGPENSWRYESGERVLSHVPAITTFGAEPGYDTYVTWTRANGPKSYTYREQPSGKSEIVQVPNTTGVGIDVSEHQGKIDWAKVKADGVTFAIIRCGYGSDYTSQDDDYFLENVRGAQANGIPFGVYLYSYATKATGAAPSAQSEAAHVLRQLKAAGLSPSKLALPVFYDLEEDAQWELSASRVGTLAEAFCSVLSSQGYKVGIYANQNWWKNKLTDPVFERSGWAKWVAQYYKKDKGTSPAGISDQQYWQFTDCGKVNGIPGYVDVNFSYAPPAASLVGPANTWAWVDGRAYYYGADGSAVIWTQRIDGKIYYFNGQHQMHTGWLTWNADSRKSYFNLGSDGKAPALTGWQQLSGKWYYFDPATGKSLRWGQKIKGSDGEEHFFYFDGASVMQEGWVTWNADGRKSYFSYGSGRAKTGWQQLGGKWYYFDPATGKSLRWGQRIGGNFFYFDGASVMQEGWVTWSADGTKSYFSYGSGRARTGWQQLSGKWYYFDPATGKSLRWGQKIKGSDGEEHFFYFDGASVMQEGWVTWNADGRKSYFSYGSGRAKTGWQQLGGKWYYFDPATGKSLRWGQRIGGNFFYFNERSEMVEGWVTWNADGRKSYFASGSGRALLGWQTLGGKRYYFDPDTGKSLVGTHVIDGEKYIFGDDSALIGGDSTTVYEPTGASFSAMAKKEYEASPASLGYTQSEIAASMNPSSYSAGTRQFYQFAQLNRGYSGMLSVEQLNGYISSTAKGRSGMLAGMGQAFIDAARLYGVNEAYLLAHAIVESGWGTSTLAKGYVYDGSTIVAGQTWPKGTYYNFYGIGAYDSSPLSGGRALAIKNGWNSPEKAVSGAAKWIATNYLNNSYGQDTLYKMRWNCAQYARYGSVGHQYATDRQWATTIAGVMSDIYTSAGISQQKAALTFLVPTYR